jgi:hypothetical protein
MLAVRTKEQVFLNLAELRVAQMLKKIRFKKIV